MTHLFCPYFTQRIVTALALLGVLATAFYWNVHMLTYGAIVLCVYGCVVEWKRLCRRYWLWWYLTPVYPVLPMYAFCMLTVTHKVPTHIFLWMVLVVAAFDSAAYAVGYCWGRHKIAPAISPGKTWEGYWGGMVGALIASVIFSYYFQWSYKSIDQLIAVFLIGNAAFVGDLFESYIKRKARVKDSGSILPGHGGVLDRIDGMLFAATVLYFYIPLFTSLLGWKEHV